MRLEDLARWRELAYRVYSSMLVYPDQGRLKAVQAATADLRRHSDSMAWFGFFPEWQRLLATLTDLSSCRIGNLEEEYIRVFLHNPLGPPCWPCESVYVDPTRHLTPLILAAVEQAYAEAGLSVSPSLHELPDHVALEFEFLAFLCGQEAQAWDSGRLTDSVQTLKRQAAFLDRHLSLWFPKLAELIATADREGVYSVVAETADAFIRYDRDLISIILGWAQTTLEASENPSESGATPAASQSLESTIVSPSFAEVRKNI